MDLPLTYTEVGATGGTMPDGYRHVRVERVIGHGPDVFARAADALLAGEVQRRAGARIRLDPAPIRLGTEVRMLLRVGPLAFRAPARVVWAKRTDTRCGFAYGTLPGHPERGEERFALELTASGAVVFRITAFSKPGRWFTRLGAPLARLVQARKTRRYLAAL